MTFQFFKTRVGGISATLAVCLVVLAVPVSTEAQSIKIASDGCPDLDITKLEQLVDMELASLASFEDGRASSELKITVEGGREEVDIGVWDSRTGKKSARTIEPPESSTEERVLALTTAQLVLISWLEEARPQPKPSPGRDESEAEPEPQPEPEPAPTPARAIEKRATTETPKKAFPERWELTVGGGIKRPGDKISALGRIGLRGAAWASSGLGVIALAAYDGGSVQRDLGDVVVQDIMLGVGVGWKSSLETAFAVEIQGTASAGYARFTGHPEDGSTGRSGGGHTAEIGLGFAPTLTLGTWTTALDLQLGYNLGSPVGNVEDDEPVTLEGFWGGVSLRTGVLF